MRLEDFLTEYFGLETFENSSPRLEPVGNSGPGLDQSGPKYVTFKSGLEEQPKSGLKKKRT